MTTKFNRKIEFVPAFDKRDSNPNKNYGISPMRIQFSVSNEKGAISYTIRTPFYNKLNKFMFNNNIIEQDDNSLALVYHCFDGKTNVCELSPNGSCTPDVITFLTDDLFYSLIEKGQEELFKKLEEILENYND